MAASYLRGYQDKNRLGVAGNDAFPKDIAEVIGAFLARAGIANTVAENARGWSYGSTRLDWRIVIGDCSFRAQLMDLERARVSKLGVRAQKAFAERTIEFGLFVDASRASVDVSWEPTRVTIFYTNKGRALTALRKVLAGLIQYEEGSAPV